MRSRDEILARLRDVDDAATFTHMDIAELSGIPYQTVRAHLNAHRRSFPSTELRGARGKMSYPLRTLKAYILAHVLRQPGFGYLFYQVLPILENSDIELLWEDFVRGNHYLRNRLFPAPGEAL